MPEKNKEKKIYLFSMRVPIEIHKQIMKFMIDKNLLNKVEAYLEVLKRGLKK